MENIQIHIQGVENFYETSTRVKQQVPMASKQ